MKLPALDADRICESSRKDDYLKHCIGNGGELAIVEMNKTKNGPNREFGFIALFVDTEGNRMGLHSNS
jgi:predicted enzyme related to lactoylglutathione lyase